MTVGGGEARDLLLFGPPGAGKGTQAVAVARTTGLPHIATGDMFRDHVARGTALGVEAKGFMDRGDLVPDTVTIGMLGERLAEPDAAGGFLLDGFPRTLVQAEALDALLARSGRHLQGVLDIEVPVEELVRRITGRLVCRASGHPYHVTDAPPRTPGICDIDGSELYRRDDDTADLVRRRYAVFEQQTAPVRGYYRDHDTRIFEIDGARQRQQVESDLVAVIGSL